MASDKIIQLSGDNFADEINSDKPILVDFWAEWCGPCRMVAPVLDELADEMDDKIRIGKVNVDNNRELSVKYKVQGIPTFLLFKNGEVQDRVTGLMPKSAFEKLIEKHV